MIVFGVVTSTSASWTAARSVQVSAAVMQTCSPGLATGRSAVELTTNTSARAACAPAAAKQTTHATAITAPRARWTALLLIPVMKTTLPPLLNLDAAFRNQTVSGAYDTGLPRELVAVHDATPSRLAS